MSDMSDEGADIHTRIDKWQKVATILSLIAVPIVVAVSGALIQESVKTSEARTKSMEIAIQILKEPPSRSDQPGLRAWAIEMLQASSSIPLSEEARAELRAKPLLSVQQIQRRIKTGGVAFLVRGAEQSVGGNQLTLEDISKDSVTLRINETSRVVIINDSVESGCVYHVLGLGFRRSPLGENPLPEDDGTQPVNSAFVAYVC
jgi:hypothetical protein